MAGAWRDEESHSRKRTDKSTRADSARPRFAMPLAQIGQGANLESCAPHRFDCVFTHTHVRCECRGGHAALRRRCLFREAPPSTAVLARHSPPPLSSHTLLIVALSCAGCHAYACACLMMADLAGVCLTGCGTGGE